MDIKQYIDLKYIKEWSIIRLTICIYKVFLYTGGWEELSWGMLKPDHKEHNKYDYGLDM